MQRICVIIVITNSEERHWPQNVCTMIDWLTADRGACNAIRSGSPKIPRNREMKTENDVTFY